MNTSQSETQRGWKLQDQSRCTHIMIFVQQAFVSIYYRSELDMSSFDSSVIDL